jgi:hypothetical protein
MMEEKMNALCESITEAIRLIDSKASQPLQLDENMREAIKKDIRDKPFIIGGAEFNITSSFDSVARDALDKLTEHAETLGPVKLPHKFNATDPDCIKLIFRTMPALFKMLRMLFQRGRPGEAFRIIAKTLFSHTMRSSKAAALSILGSRLAALRNKTAQIINQHAQCGDQQADNIAGAFIYNAVAATCASTGASVGDKTSVDHMVPAIVKRAVHNALDIALKSGINPIHCGEETKPETIARDILKGYFRNYQDSIIAGFSKVASDIVDNLCVMVQNSVLKDEDGQAAVDALKEILTGVQRMVRRRKKIDADEFTLDKKIWTRRTVITLFGGKVERSTLWPAGIRNRQATDKSGVLTTIHACTEIKESELNDFVTRNYVSPWTIPAALLGLQDGKGVMAETKAEHLYNLLARVMVEGPQGPRTDDVKVQYSTHTRPSDVLPLVS